jgi:hypothetical protein
MSAPFLQKDSIKCWKKSHYVRGSLSLENYNKSPIFVFQTSLFDFYCRSGFWKISKLSSWKGTMVMSHHITNLTPTKEEKKSLLVSARSHISCKVGDYWELGYILFTKVESLGFIV